MKNKNILIVGAVALCCLLMLGGTYLLASSLHEKNTAVETLPTVVEQTNIAKGPESTVAGKLEVSISEDAEGFDQNALLAAAVDYCNKNGITGKVVVIDAELIDDMHFTITMSTSDGDRQYTFLLSDYKN